MAKLDQSTPVIPEIGFLRLPSVLKLIPISRSSWYSGIQTGRYPRGVKLSANTTAWRAEDIRELINELSEQGGEHAA